MGAQQAKYSQNRRIHAATQRQVVPSLSRIASCAAASRATGTRNGERIRFPIEDRSLRILPHPYRLEGGDVSGWDWSFCDSKSPSLPGHIERYSAT